MIATHINAPLSIEEIGLRRNLLEDLAVKTLFFEGEMSLRDLGCKMQLSLPIAEEIFQRLRKEGLCEVKGMTVGIHHMAITDQGRRRALDLLSVSQYVGAAPICSHDYVNLVRSQSARNVEVHAADVARAFRHLVLSEDVLRRLGTAAVSGTTIFLYGPSGSGKTSIAEALPQVYGDAVWIPHAVEVDGQIIKVFDPAVHKPVEPRISEDGDGRWVLCRRPRVIVGGELTIEMLDLQFDPAMKFYTAPVQMQANNGVLVIDDFGRQRVRADELLNRWIVPLDRRIDYLTLAGGKKFEIPFELFVVFATNLDPATLADEAFLRRIQNKVKIDNVSPEQFREIFGRVCRDAGMEYEPGVADHLMNVLETDVKQPLRPCYPRDIIAQIGWVARYDGAKPRVDRENVTQACRRYFLPT